MTRIHITRTTWEWFRIPIFLNTFVFFGCGITQLYVNSAIYKAVSADKTGVCSRYTSGAALSFLPGLFGILLGLACGFLFYLLHRWSKASTIYNRLDVPDSANDTIDTLGTGEPTQTTTSINTNNNDNYDNNNNNTQNNTHNHNNGQNDFALHSGEQTIELHQDEILQYTKSKYSLLTVSIAVGVYAIGIACIAPIPSPGCILQDEKLLSIIISVLGLVTSLAFPILVWVFLANNSYLARTCFPCAPWMWLCLPVVSLLAPMMFPLLFIGGIYLIFRWCYRNRQQ